jgi:hypothetical protein
MFVLSGYWGTWSRVLGENHPEGRYIEVNLTPINGATEEEWRKDVLPIRIRAHSTTRKRDDKIVDRLPAVVEARLIAHLGKELTARLLTEDFLSQIDWALYRKHCNGGANLDDIRIAG